jgi:hypothetical protein
MEKYRGRKPSTETQVPQQQSLPENPVNTELPFFLVLVNPTPTFYYELLKMM